MGYTQDHLTENVDGTLTCKQPITKDAIVCVYNAMVEVGLTKAMVQYGICAGSVPVYKRCEGKTTQGMVLVPWDGVHQQLTKNNGNALLCKKSICLPTFLEGLREKKEDKMEKGLHADLANVALSVFKMIDAKKKKKNAVCLRATRDIAVKEEICVYYGMNYWLRCVAMGNCALATNKEIYQAQEYMIARCGSSAEEDGGDMQIIFLRENCITMIITEDEAEGIKGIMIKHPTTKRTTSTIFQCCLNTMYQRLKYLPTTPRDILPEILYRLQIEARLCNTPINTDNLKQTIMTRWKIQHEVNQYQE